MRGLRARAPVADAKVGVKGGGTVGLFMASDTGTAEFLFSDFSVRPAK